jgi:hypothetical protein
VTTRAQVLELLDQGHTYESAARELRIPAGRAYMIATGLPADSGTPSLQDPAVNPLQSGSTQQFVNPPAFNPTRNQRVIDWVRRRAEHDLRPPRR